ncbi:DUF4097 family beta strand repeat-containing protein [Amycolatopsis sp. CA-230715]|uniref:DUF4097 family beta strand repeat-containing protein n=1 Tax=Amycolatopsis sp. CA-230715 TaxID=2745196 RepID=UPI001C033900|nr:DUF4097 family beta strand repeat-containing protein [Amycolatopsis sp. CA-230715]QWF80722.1 hypothetical protein HUW46_04146 [Amycolatopsis sp. CA-230715]
MGRPALALGGLALIGLGVVMATGWWWPSSAHAEASVAQAVKSVRIDNSSGKIDIQTGDVTESTVRQAFNYHWGDKPGNSFRVEGDTLVLADCGSGCSVDYDVVVPKGTAVTGKNGSGDVRIKGVASVDVSALSGQVTVQGVEGPATVGTTSGDIEVHDIGGEVKAHAQSGHVRGDGLRAKTDAEAQSGDVDLKVTSPQDVRAHTGSGSVKLVIPQDTYRVEGDSGSGDRKISVNQSASGTHLLDLDTGSGDVSVVAA